MPNEQKDMSVIRLGLINKQGSRIEPAKTGKGSLVPWSIMGVALATGANSHSDNPQTNTPETNTPPVLSLRPLKWLTISNADKATGALKPIDEFNPIRGQFIAIDIDKDILTYSVINRPDNEMDFGKFTLNPNTGEWVFAFNEDITFDEFVNLMFEIKIEDGKGGEDIEIFTIILGNSDGVLVEPLSDNERNRILADVDEELGDLILPVSDTEPDLFGRPPFINRDDPQDDPRDYFPDDRDDPRDDNRDNTRGDTPDDMPDDTPDDTPDDMPDDPTDGVNNAPVLTPSSYGRTITDESADGTNVPDPTSGVFMAMDADNDDLIWTVDEPSNVGDFGSFTLSEDTGVWVFMPNAGINSLGAGVREVLEFTITVDDQNGGRDTATVTITLEGVNDAPREVISDGLSVIEGEASDITMARLRFDDADNTKAELIYTITDAPDHGTLLVQGVNRGSGGTFTQADIDARDVRYQHGGSENLADSFAYSVSDGENTVTGSFAITVAPISDAPTQGRSGGFSVAEGGESAITTALLEFSDVDNTEAELTYTIDVAPLHGTLLVRDVEIGSDGTFTQDDIDENRVRYQHDGSENHADSFAYSVSDGENTVTGSFAITILPVNDAPVQVRSGGFSVVEGEASDITTARLQFTDVDNAQTDLTYTIDTAPDHGTLRLQGVDLGSGGTFTQANIDARDVRYEHDGSENHDDSFTYSVNDGTNTGTVTGSFDITITPVSDAPTQERSGGFSVAEGEASAITSALLEFTDVDNAATELTYAITDAPDHGRLEILNGSVWQNTNTFRQDDIDENRVRYQHDGSENHADSFAYSVSDGVNSVRGNFAITISPVNDAPVQVRSVGLSVAEGEARDITTARLEFSDVDNGATELTYTIDTAPLHGTLRLQGVDLGSGGTFTQANIDARDVRYEHDGSENRADSFTYSVSDGENTVTGSFDITVAPVSDAPTQVRSEGLTGVNEGEVGTITTALLEFTDVDNGAADLIYTIDVAPLYGTLQSRGFDLGSGGTFTQDDIDGNHVRYEHDGSENHADSFAYSVRDGTNTVTGSFAITVDPVSDAPTQVRSDGLTNVNEGEAGGITTALLQFTDVDNAAADLTYTIDTAPLHGRLERLNVSVWENTNTFTQADIDGNRVRYQHGGSENHDDSFTYSVSDGTNTVMGNFAITITPVSDAPTQVRSEGFSVAEGEAAVIMDTLHLQFNDVDNAATELTYTITDAPDHGGLEISDDGGSTWGALGGRTFTQNDIDGGRVRYQHDGSENHADSFAYSVSDSVNSVTGNFAITISPVNDAPMQVRSGGFSVAEGEAGGITTALLEFTDVDNGATELTYTIDTAPLYGTLQISDDGGSTWRALDLVSGETFTQADINRDTGANRVRYEHDGSENRADIFEYSVRDGAVGDSNTNTVTGSFDITVAPVSDSPTQVSSGGFSVAEGGASDITSALLQFNDVDNGVTELTYAITDAPDHGRLEILNGSVWENTNTFTQANIDEGRVRYQHDGSENHADSFAYSVRDGENTVPGSFAITIIPVSDAPMQVRSDDLTNINEGEAGGITNALLQFTDVDNAATDLTYTITDAPDHGRLEILNGSVWENTNTFTQDDIDGNRVRYQHDGSENHDDSLAYSVSDGENTVMGSFDIAITPVSDAPTQVRSEGFSVAEGEAAVIMDTLHLQFNDVDNAATELTYTITDAPDHGRLEILNGSVWQNTNTFTQDDIDGGRVRYQHGGSENHADSFAYSVSDSVNSVTGNFAITISPVNDAPMQVRSGGFSVAEGEAGGITTALLEFTDVDNGATELTYTIDTAPLYGTLQISEDDGSTWLDLDSGETFTQADINRDTGANRVRYEHDGSENRADSFTYSVSDGENTVTGSFDITVAPVSDAPTQVSSEGLTGVNEGEVGTITTALLEFTDVDNAATDLTYTIDVAPLYGTLLLQGANLGSRTFTQANIDAGQVQYRHDGSENHADSFAYSVRDGTNTVTGSFAITVDPVSDAPTQVRSDGLTNVNEGEAGGITTALLQFTDVDNAAADLTYTIDTAPLHGRLERLNVSVWENTNTFTQADIDGNRVRYQHGGSENHDDSFTYSVSDGTNTVMGNFAITITPVSDAPTQVRSEGFSVAEGEAAVIMDTLHLQFNDVDNAATELTYTITDAPDHGGLEISDDGGSTWGALGGRTFTQNDIDEGRVRYRHDGSENHADSFAYSVSDSVNSVTGNFAITITPVSDAPMQVRSGGLSVAEGEAAVIMDTLHLQFNDVDNTATELTYTITDAPDHGGLEISDDGGSTWGALGGRTFTQNDIDGGRVRYQHDGSENHADSFAYSVSDGTNTVTGNFAITVDPVSDAPMQESSGGFSVAEGGASAITSALLQFTDVDNGVTDLTYTITDAPDYGRLEISDDGGSTWAALGGRTFTQNDIDGNRVRYQHDGSENHDDSFAYSVSDGENTVTGNFAITITPVSDAPMQVRSDGLTNVNEGEIGGITTALLQFTDVDNTAVELTYAITDAPDHGRLEILNGSVWENTNTFTQDDIDEGRVRYQHDGSENHADSFAYSVSDSVNSVTGNFAITISPVNDAPTATETTSPAPDKAVVESGHNDDGSDDAGDNMASGSFTHSDPDMAQSGFVAGTPEAARDGMTNYTSTPVRGMYGTLTLTAGTWSYEIDNSATDMLDENDSVTDSFLIRIRDTAGEVSNAIPIDIMITGTNDRPVITTTGGGQSLTDTSADDHIGSASAPRTITGTAVASDVDADDGDGANGADDFTWSIVDGGTRPLGMLVFNNGGVGGDWTFTADADAFNALAREGRETLTYHVQARDLQGAVSEAMDLTITLEGINDTPELAVNMNMVDNDVTEAGGVNNAAIGDAMADGSLTITDPDIGHNDFAFAGNTLQGRAGTSGVFKNANGVEEGGVTSDGQIIGTYGTLTLERDGTWSYALRDDDPDTQALDGGDTPDMVQDIFQIQLVNVDGTTEISAIVPITIDVTGANDAPTIITQDPNITTSALNPIDGTLDVTDPDADDGDDTNDFTWEGTLQDTALARFVSSFEITPSTSVNAQGDWSFTPDETAFNALNHGQRQQLVYDIRVTDRQGAISEKSTLTITLEGVDDAPTLMVMDTQTPRAKERGGHNNNQRTTSATSGAFAAALTGAVALGAFAYDDADAADTGFGAGGTIQGRHSTDTDADYEDGGTVNGMNIAGTYGTLSLRADGSWEYVLNEANAAVQALNDGEVGVLSETFQFRIEDIVGTTTNNIYSNVITIDIDIEGTNDAPELTVTYDETTEVSRFVQEDTTSDTQSGDLTFADVDQGDTIPGLIVFASTTDGGLGSGTEDTTPPLPTATNVIMRVDAGATTVRDDYGDFELTRDATTGQVAWTYRIDDTRARELRQWVDGQANSEEIQTLYVRAWDKASGGLASDIHTIQVEVRGTNDAPEIAELGTLDKAITESGHGDAVGVNVFADDDGVTGDVGLSALSVNNPNSDRVANGRFSFTDPDLGQGGFNTDVGGVNTITGGTIQAVHADDATSPTYTDVASTAATVATGQVFDATYGRFFVRIDGTWSYVVDNTRSVTQGLDEGDMMQDVFSIRVRDNDHAVAGTPADTVFSEALVIRITITGTNDRPTIDDTNGGRDFVDASDTDHTRPEGSAPQMFIGTAVASDVDADDGANGANDFTWVIAGSATRPLGALVFDNGGVGGGWTFTTDADAFNALAHDQRQTLTYSVQARDPQGALSVASDLTITLVGIDDVSTNLEHVDTGIDLEVQRPGGRDVDGDFAASGTLRFMDVDGDTFSDDHIFIQGNPRGVSFESFAHEGDDEGLGTDINGVYGTLYLKDDGTWSYMLDNTRFTTQRITNGESAIERFHFRIESRITGRTEHLNSNILPLNIIVRGMEVMALTNPDALTDIIYDEVASGQIVAMVGARAPRGDTTFTVALNQDDDGTASLDNDIGRFEIGDDGSWTYTITSIPVLDRLAGRVGNGNATLDPGEMLTQTFYITAHNDTIPEPNREETIRVDVLINGMDIITPDSGSRLDPFVDGNTAYIGDDRGNEVLIVNGRHIVFGGEGEDNIIYNANHQGAISFYHRFESLDSGGWENMDGSDIIVGFTRNQGSFTLVDIDDSPVSEDTFVGATGDIGLHAVTLQSDPNRLVGFELVFLDGAAIPQVISGIQFRYSGSGIDLSDMNNRNLFYGTSNITHTGRTESFTIEGTLDDVDIRRVNDLSLLENYFGDSEDNFRVVDELPVVILDALTTGGSIFYDEIASGRAELPRDTTNLFVTIDEYYRDGTATSLDDGVGRFEVKADGSWTYTITSIQALHTAANAAGLGPTLDADEVLTRVFYLHALDETLSGANRLATLELDVVINGANIITPSPSFGLLSPVIRSDTAYIGDARDNQINFVDGRHIVFGSTGADTILVTSVVAGASIWHRFSSHDSVPWENTDGEDVNNHFTRNQDSFTFVDIDGTPVDEAAFLASPQTEFRAIIQLGELVGFDLRFVDPDNPSNMSIIQFDYTDPIFIPDEDIASFFGTGPLADSARVLINLRLASRGSVQVEDPNLWGHFFGDDDDSFRVVDDLPVVILDALTTGDGFLDDVSGRAEVPRDTTNLFVTLDETYTDTGRATALGDGVGRFEIKADGSWTYTITSIPALYTAANAAGLGSTLDADEVLTRVFYIHAIDETLSGANRLATLELDVVINGANIITPDPLTGSLTPIISSDTVYIGDARDNQINSVNGRHIVFGSTGADTITDSTNVGVASIWHRFSSHDSGTWENTDGEDVINNFTRNQDSFTLVDIDGTPIDEATFLADPQTEFQALILSGELVGFDLDPGDLNTASIIRFNYTAPIVIPDDDIASFFGTGSRADRARQIISSSTPTITSVPITDPNLWGHFFGDDDDSFRVVDDLPVVILDALTTGDSIFPDEIASGRAEVPRDTTNLFVTLDETYTDTDRATALDDGVGRFEIKADGSWTYTITSILALDAAANAAGLGPTLDADEALTRVFYIHAIDETLSGANSLVTRELDVVINGANILMGTVMGTANDHEVLSTQDNVRNIVFGADVFGVDGVSDTIRDQNQGTKSIYYRFSSGDGGPWDLPDNSDSIQTFTRNEDTFTFVDISDSPLSEADFLATENRIRLLVRYEGPMGSERLVQLSLQFFDPPGSSITILYAPQSQWGNPSAGIRITPDNEALFFGEGRAGIALERNAVSGNVEPFYHVNDRSLWGHYFGDSEDDFRVIDQLPVVILDALATGDGDGFFGEVVSGRAETPSGTTKFYATLDPAYTGRATVLDDGVGRFEIKADGSWTYTVTSLNELEAAVVAANLGHTLDVGETLTRVFYIHAIDETLSEANRLATLELDVQINGMNIIAAPEGQTTNRLGFDPNNPGATLFIGADGVDIIQTAVSMADDDRKVVFGGPGDDIIDIIGTEDEGAISIYYRFSSGDGSSWENTDGTDVILKFTRNRDKFILVDESDNPVSEADFINPLIADGRVELEISIITTLNAIEYFDLVFQDPINGDSTIRFNYETPIDVSGAGGDPFLGVGRNGVQPVASTLVQSQTFTVTDRSLWGNYFGDGDDGFQVIDELPAVIADAVARKNIFLDQTAFGSAEPPPTSSTPTTYEAAIVESVHPGSVRQFDAGFGEFNIDPNTGSWTYALTSYNTLNNAFSNITRVPGSTLDTGDTLTRTFYVYTVQEGSRVATQEVNVTLHGLNIVTANANSNLLATEAGNSAYIGNAMNNIVLTAPGRHVVFGGLGTDTILDNTNLGELTIYHRFSSTDNGGWENTDGLDVINHFVRNEDTFILVDINATPVSEAVFINNSQVQLETVLNNSSNAIEYFVLEFDNGNSVIRFNYETPIDVSGNSGDQFLGVGRNGVQQVNSNTAQTTFTVTDRSLWGNYFGDHEGNFQVIDTLPAVIDDLI